MPDDVIDHVARELEHRPLDHALRDLRRRGHRRLKFAKIKEAFEQIQGAEVWGAKYGRGRVDKITHPAEQVEIGIPNLDINTMTGWYGGEEGGHVGFSPAAPLSGKRRRRGCAICCAASSRRRQSSTTSPRCCRSTRAASSTSRWSSSTRRTRQQVRARLRHLEAARREAAKQGYGEYRAHLDFMDLAAEQYSFNDHAYRRFCETIKDALDPNGILVARPARDLAEVDAPGVDGSGAEQRERWVTEEGAGRAAARLRRDGLDPNALRVLDALLERLLPGDELGGGAREAEVVRYIDRALGAEYREHLDRYAAALVAIDGHAVSAYQRPFVVLEPEEQDAIVSALEQGAIPGVDSNGAFFDLLRRHLIEGMFGDPRWGATPGSSGGS